MAALVCLGGCAGSATTQTGALASYDQMTPVKSARSKALIYADADALAQARTIRIAPVTYGDGAGDRVSPKQQALIADILGRVLCVRLSQRFEVVAADTPADLTVKVFITRMTPTNRTAASLSMPLRVASMATGAPLPGRLPVGLGTFTAEGEALDSAGARRAAMVWARGADVFTNQARVSRIGDAFELSGAFAGDMAALIITAKNPLHDVPKLSVGGAKRPVSPVCDLYGKANGAETFMSGLVGGPPEWTYKKPAPTSGPPQ